MLGLQRSSDQALDRLDVPLHDWTRLRGGCEVPLWFRILVRLGHGRFQGRRLLQRLMAQLCQSATVALAYTQVYLQGLLRILSLEAASMTTEWLMGMLCRGCTD